MSDRDALYNAILAAPDDDAPRLVYADWLDEHGDSPRAEFIRVQCELARTPYYEPRYVALERRAAQLHPPVGADWLFGWVPHRQAYHRGFIEEMWLRADTYVRRHAELQAALPLRRVHFTDEPAGEVWRWSDIVHLSGIEFPDCGWDQGADGGIELPALRWLKITGLEGGGFYFTEFSCPNIESFDASGAHYGRLQLHHTLRQAELEGLRELTIDADENIEYHQRLRAAGARWVSQSGLRSLRLLSIRRQLIGDAGLSHLARSADLAGLENLDLGLNEIGTIGTTGIEDLCLHLQHLKSLSLAENRMDLAAVRELADWPGLRRLRWLDLSDCGLPVAAGKVLAGSPYLHPGLALRVDGNDFDPAKLFPADVLRRAAPSVS